MKLLLLTFVSAVTVAAAPAAAQDICPSGSSITVIRLSKLTPGGTLAGARQAAADHEKWYTTHGYKNDKIVFAPAPTLDTVNNKVLPASNQFYTFHTKATEVPKDKHDAAWAAYVDEYNKNSTIVSTSLACVPD